MRVPRSVRARNSSTAQANAKHYGFAEHHATPQKTKPSPPTSNFATSGFVGETGTELSDGSLMCRSQPSPSAHVVPYEKVDHRSRFPLHCLFRGDCEPFLSAVCPSVFANGTQCQAFSSIWAYDSKKQSSFFCLDVVVPDGSVLAPQLQDRKCNRHSFH